MSIGLFQPTYLSLQYLIVNLPYHHTEFIKITQFKNSDVIPELRFKGYGDSSV